jgi:hypothetical protein
MTNMSLLLRTRNPAIPIAYPIKPTPYSGARFVASETSRSVLPLIVLYRTGTNGATHNVRIPSNAEDNGFISGPIPIGENQEKAIDMMAPTANGVNILENVSATQVSQLTCRLTLVPY